MKEGKNFKCVHCGRQFKDRCIHRCRGTIRKRNLIFIDRNGTTWEKGWKRRISR